MKNKATYRILPMIKDGFECWLAVIWKNGRIIAKTTMMSESGADAWIRGKQYRGV